MSVKCLTHNRKMLIAHQFSFLKIPIKELAMLHEVSPRTIQRVLKEQHIQYSTRNKTVSMAPQKQLELPLNQLPELSTFETLKIAFNAFVVRPLKKLAYDNERIHNKRRH